MVLKLEHTHTQSIVIIDRLTVKWVAPVRETRHQLREAVASKGYGRRRFCVGIVSWLL
jgi:hypothetical protein